MKYTLILIFLLQVAFTVNLPGQIIVEPAQNDALFPAQSALIGGFIGGKLDASYQNRIMAQDVDRLIAPFRNRIETSCWQSEFWGKWFTSAVLAYRYRPEPQLKKVLDQAVDGLIATQTPDGYIGNYADDKHLAAWDIWGRKYCMLGLLAYYDLTKEQKALNAAAKEADFLMTELKNRNALIVKMGNHRGMAASSVLEPICLLYGRTGDQKYLAFAEEIVRQWETPDGPQLISKATVPVAERFPKPKINWYGWEQGQKAYEMMSCYEGLLELYRLTGKKDLLTAVEKTWQNIRETEIDIVGSGSARECWFGGKRLQVLPVRHFQETCVTATWIKLSQQLLCLTGDSKYAEAIEQSYYNALLGAMNSDGSVWGYYTPLSGYKILREEQCGMGINCCTASGPRALFTFPLTAIMGCKDGVQVNFYAEGEYLVQTPGKQLAEISQTTNYPVDGEIKIGIKIANGEGMTIRIRIPDWSKKSQVTVNGQVVDGVISGQYAVIHREWKSGDVIALVFEMNGRIIHQEGETDNLAIIRGPIVLSRDSRLPGPVVDAWLTPLINKDGYLDLELVAQDQQGFWMQIKANCKYEPHSKEGDAEGSLLFCDYASSGNTYDEHSRFRTWFPQLIDPERKKKE